MMTCVWGDTPEPAYILTLDARLCVSGDAFVEDGTAVDRIHLIEDPHGRSVLKGLIGRSISVVGRDMFGAHTGHHHAPLLMTVVSATPLARPADAGLALTTVEAFYLSLEIGDGEAAASNVVPEKRAKGPLSAKALSAFYGNLKRPLELVGVSPVAADRFRARYTFETRGGLVCDGPSVVTTKQVGGLNLISGIRSESGC